MNERPTFSPFWHRVRAMKPKLRAHVQITRQRYRGRRWHVVHDPTSNQFYRLNPVAFDFISSLDGGRTIEEAWKVSLTKFGDSSPTQNEIIQLLSQLYSSNLLSVDTTPETEQLLRRGRERRQKKFTAQAVGIMYFKIKLLNPDRLLTNLEPLFRPLINRFGFLAWLALMVAAMYAVTNAGKWPEFISGIDSYLNPANWGLIMVAFVVSKLWHELGHGIICKRYGGQVPEFGVMMLVLIPSPYVDASACWAFPDKWKRIAVGAGGMLFEWVLAAAAAFVWLSADDGSDLKQIAYNLMFTSSVSTLLFNANPLMRFDGYYILSDLIEVPNLAQRSQKMLHHFFQQYIYRLRNLTPPTTQPGEAAILYIYGLLSGAYRVFLFFTITLYILGQAFALGLVLAVWTAAAWFLIPTGKFIHWLASSPQHHDRRPRSFAVSLAMIALLAFAVGWLPMPDRRHGDGVVESIAQSGVYFQTDGFLEQAHKRIGDRVVKDEPIATLHNPDMIEQRRGTLGQLEEFRIQERQALSQQEPGAAEVARERIRVTLEQISELDDRIRGLVVRAPHDGVVVSANPDLLVGAFVKRGDPLCEVVDAENIRIAAVLDQRQAGWLADLSPSQYRVQIKPVSDTTFAMDARNVRTPGAAQRVLPSRALGFEGGGRYETDREDRSGLMAVRPLFTLLCDPVDPAALLQRTLPGARVAIRFRLQDRPLLSQWYERLERELQGRVKL